MIDRWRDRLSEFLDRELSKREAVELEWHLQSCLECRRMLEELQAVKARAQTLTDTAPATELWPTLLERLQTTPQLDLASLNVIELHARKRPKSERRITLTLPQLAAASVALMLLSGGLVWFALSGSTRAPVASAPTRGSAQLVSAVMDDYNSAVQVLEAALQQRRGRLDPATVAVLEQNLRVIDAAIADAQAALAADPSNAYLNHHLENTMKKKVQLLRRATVLRSASS